MDYFKLMDNFLAEVRQLRQYKRLPIIPSILIAVCMLPVMIVCFGIFIFYEILAFIHKAMATPTEVLKNYVKQERNEIGHITQAVFYLITQPWIFMCEILLSFISLIFYFVWFFFMAAAYLATLGGVKWQPFITEAKFDNCQNYTYRPSNIVATVYAALTAVSMFIWAVSYLSLYETPDQQMYDLYRTFVGIYVILVCIVNPLIFKKIPINRPQMTETVEAECNQVCDSTEFVENTPLESEQVTPVADSTDSTVQENKTVDNTPFRCSECDKLINRSVCPYCGTHNHRK